MVKKSIGDKTIDIFAYIFMGIFSVFCIVPFKLIVSGSLSDEQMIQNTGFSLIPRNFTLFSYEVLFKDNSILDAYKTTILYTLLGTFFCLILTSAMAYGLSVKTFTHRNKIAFLVYFTMLFSGGLVPSYLLIAKYLNLRNTIWVYILPALINPYNMFLLRNFFKQIPESLSESATIDGANDIYILLKIILPIAKPALATIGLFYAFGFWNEWFTCTLYINNNRADLYSLQYLIMRIFRMADFFNSAMNDLPGARSDYLLPSNTIKMATAVVTIGPIVFVYPFVQKYFVKGLVVGAVKG